MRTVLITLSMLLPMLTFPQAGYLGYDRVWHEEFAVYDGLTSHHSAFTLTITGDTLINGLSYYKVHQLGSDTVGTLGSSAPPTVVPLDRHIAALRETIDPAQWWVIFQGHSTEQLLYDFDLELGDVLSGTFGDCSASLEVASIDEVSIGGEIRRRFHFAPWNFHLIEGVGASSGLFGHLCHFIEEFGCLHRFTLGAHTLDVDGCGQLTTDIRQHDAPEDAPFPNPTTGRCALGNAATGRPVQVLDGAGRMLEVQRAGPGGSLDLRHLECGSYFLRSTERTFRLLKE